MRISLSNHLLRIAEISGHSLPSADCVVFISVEALRNEVVHTEILELGSERRDASDGVTPPDTDSLCSTAVSDGTIPNQSDRKKTLCDTKISLCE